MCSLDQCYSSRLIGLVLLLTCVFFTYSLDISSIAGEVTFDVKLPPGVNSVVDRADVDERERMIMHVVRRNVTVAPLVECQYQYPEKEQVDALLSNMMNELTKVFIRAQHLVLGDEDLTSVRRRLHERRFKVVAKKNTNFFENIYKNMTKEYLNFYNSTAEHVSRARRDPCTNQPLIRQMWRDILDNSIGMLRSAARSTIQVPKLPTAEHVSRARRDPCTNQPLIRQMWRDIMDNSIGLLRSAARSTIQEHKRMLNSSEPSKARIDQFLARQVSKVKADQLHLLCYNFQLCFNDLL